MHGRNNTFESWDSDPDPEDPESASAHSVSYGTGGRITNMKLFWSFMEFVLRPFPKYTNVRWASHYLSGRGTKMYLPQVFMEEQLLQEETECTKWAVAHGLYFPEARLRKYMVTWETTVGKFLYRDTATMRHIIDQYIFYENCDGVQVHCSTHLDEACSSNHCYCGDMFMEWPTSTMKTKKITLLTYNSENKHLRRIIRQMKYKHIHFGPLSISFKLWNLRDLNSKHKIQLHISPKFSDEWMSKHGKPFWSVGHIPLNVQP